MPLAPVPNRRRYRIDLEGKPAGTVSERHAGAAKHRLAALQKRRTLAGAAVNAPKKKTITSAPAKQKTLITNRRDQEKEAGKAFWKAMMTNDHSHPGGRKK